jgi:acetyltransferase-like isoleucine patch superfamily enzyme
VAAIAVHIRDAQQRNTVRLLCRASWRRAEILGRPLHIGADSWIGLITIIAIGLAIAAGVYVAARHYRLKT